jgi:4'-phosphopantetheinyl transferase
MHRPAPPLIFWTNLDYYTPILHQVMHWLDIEELKRASRYSTPKLRFRNIAARLFLRGVLANLLRCTPETIVFKYHIHGKPFVDNDLEFNLSHSGSFAVLAIHSELDVGIDIEQMDQKISTRGLALTLSAIEERTPPKNKEDWLRLWVRKEAIIKSSGLGFSENPSKFTTGYKPYTGWRTIDSIKNVAWDGELPNRHIFSIALSSAIRPSAPPIVVQHDISLLSKLDIHF